MEARLRKSVGELRFDLRSVLPQLNTSQVQCMLTACHRIFERALAYCGSDYVAHSLWDKYINFEEEQGATLHVAALYTRALGHPLRELPRYWSR